MERIGEVEARSQARHGLLEAGPVLQGMAGATGPQLDVIAHQLKSHAAVPPQLQLLAKCLWNRDLPWLVIGEVAGASMIRLMRTYLVMLGVLPAW